MSLLATVRSGPFAVTNRYAPRLEPVPVVIRSGDPWIVFTVVLLVGLGIVMVLNTSFFFSGDRYGDAYHVFRKHLISVGIGGVACFLASHLGSRHYQQLAYPLLGLAVLALIAVLLPGVGLVRGGARRWVALGPLNFQPSEFTKVVAVLYLAHSIVRKGPQIRTFTRGIIPHAIVVGILAALVVVEPDFGTAVLLVVIAGAMLFVGGARWRDLALPLVATIPLFVYAVRSSPYRIRRVLTFLDPWQDPLDAGFQLVQSILAVGSGGLFGSGLGESQQKMFYLPEAHTDFIFSVIGEEFGLVGALAFVLLFGVLAARGFRVAVRHPTPFGRLVAFGITLLLVLQAAVNMAVVLGLLPTKGLALPFISYGGSAMLTSLTSVGVLLALSRESG